MAINMTVLTSKASIEIKSLDGVECSREELRLDAILALIESMDSKDYEKYGSDMHDKLDSDLERIAKTVHDTAASNQY